MYKRAVSSLGGSFYVRFVIETCHRTVVARIVETKEKKKTKKKCKCKLVDWLFYRTEKSIFQTTAIKLLVSRRRRSNEVFPIFFLSPYTNQ
jgi:hypothetical protein